MSTEISPELERQLLDRISKARAWLVINQPFVAALALGMSVKVSRQFETAAATYDTLYFNPEFTSTLDDQELLFLVAHEVFHPMFEHNSRRMGRDPKKWNIAADYVINEHLTNEGIGRMPQGGLRNTALFTAAEGSTDRLYEILPDNQDKGQGQGQGQGQGIPDQAPWEDIVEETGSPAETAEKEADMKVRIAQAAQAAKMAGKFSAGMKRLFGELIEPKIDWRDVLRNFVTKARTDQRSYARPNRRFMSQGLVMPSVSGETMGEMLVAVDCSGSIDEKVLSTFAAEIKAIHEDTRPVRLHVVYFDSKVCHHDTFTCDDEVRIDMHGGGGTRFSPVFRYAEQHEIDPVCCVFLTDLYCDDFGNAPDYPVLWVTNGTDRAPWGQVIKM